jgi:hypothetical protein
VLVGASQPLVRMLLKANNLAAGFSACAVVMELLLALL